METAKHSPGAHRFKWHWDGKYYTPQGVEVPEEVWREDELLIQSGQALAPDDQVLDMKVTLPQEALPHPFVLSPILPEADNSLPPVEANVPDQGLPDEEEEEVEEEVEEDTPEGKKVVKKTVKRKKAAKRK